MTALLNVATKQVSSLDSPDRYCVASLLERLSVTVGSIWEWTWSGSEGKQADLLLLLVDELLRMPVSCHFERPRSRCQIGLFSGLS